MNGDITIFAETTFRNQRKKFGIKEDDRRRHIYTVGKTGMGKTVMLENMVIQDIQRGYGVAVVDPHGEFAEKMLDFVPSYRVNDVIYFNPADRDHPIAFNILEKVDPSHRHLIASGLMGVFKKIWPDVWSARMEYLLNNAFLSLLEYPGSTLLGVNRLFAEKDFRQKVVDKITDSAVKSFWINEFAKYPDRFREEAVAPIQNKVGQFISVPLIRNIIGQTKSAIDMREAMDAGKILIVNLSKGKLGEDNSQLLGAMIITKLQLAAMSRIDVPEEDRKDFYLYVDEFQNFATDAFANILSEARKYRLCLIMAHQYIAQLDSMTEKGRSTKVRDAVFGNVGTMIVFRIGAEDAEFLEKEFIPDFTGQDLVNLKKYNIYLKLMIDGVASKAFSAETLAPFSKLDVSHKDKITRLSRERYGTPREIVEGKIIKWYGPISSTKLEEKEPRPAGTLFDVKCWECGKDTKVVFEPDGKRPVYCKKCLKERQSNIPRQSDKQDKSKDEYQKEFLEEKKEETKTTSLGEAITKESVFFKPPKEKENKENPPKLRVKVNLEELRQTLKEALGKEEKSDDNNTDDNSIIKNQNQSRSGILKPGETIKL